MAMSTIRKGLNDLLKKQFGYTICNPSNGKVAILTKDGKEVVSGVKKKVTKQNKSVFSISASEVIINLYALKKTDDTLKVDKELESTISFEELEAMYKIACALKDEQKKPVTKKVATKKVIKVASKPAKSKSKVVKKK